MESCEDESKQQTQSQNALKKNNRPIHYLNRGSTRDITMSIKKEEKKRTSKKMFIKTPGHTYSLHRQGQFRSC